MKSNVTGSKLLLFMSLPQSFLCPPTLFDLSPLAPCKSQVCLFFLFFFCFCVVIRKFNMCVSVFHYVFFLVYFISIIHPENVNKKNISIVHYTFLYIGFVQLVVLSTTLNILKVCPSIILVQWAVVLFPLMAAGSLIAELSPYGMRSNAIVLKPTRTYEKPYSFLTPPTCPTQPAQPLNKEQKKKLTKVCFSNHCLSW